MCSWTYRFFTCLVFLISLSTFASDYVTNVVEDSTAGVGAHLLFPSSRFEIAYDQIITPPKNGTVTFLEEYDNKSLKYEPNSNFCGSDSVTVSFIATGFSDTIGLPGDNIFSISSNIESSSITNFSGTVSIFSPENKTISFSVSCVNDQPRIIGTPDQANFKNGINDLVTGEDTNKTVGFTVRDAETPANNLVVSVLSSSNTSLLPTSRVILGGSGSSRNVTLKPAANKYGYSDVRLRVTDTDGGYHDDVFRFTVNSVNDVPIITDIANQSTNEDTNKTVGFTVSDVETAANDLLVSVVSSSNVSLLPTSRVILGGSGSSRNVTLKPVANKHGYSNIRLRVTDANGVYRDDVFRLTVNNVNDTPTISNIANQQTNEDTNKTVNFTVNDLETTASSLLVSVVSSSNSGLLPTSRITLGGSGSSRSVTLKPSSNKHGYSDIRLRVTDSDGGYRDDVFRLTVNSVNDAPTIANISSQNTNEDTSKIVTFNINDFETPASSLVVSTVSSSNSSLLPISSIILGGSGSSRNVTMEPTVNKYGYSDVRLRVTDADGAYSERIFRLNVNSINDAPEIVGPNSINLIAGNQKKQDFQLNDIDSPLATLSGVVSADNPALFDSLSVSVVDGKATLALQASTTPGSTSIHLDISDENDLKTTKSIPVQILNRAEAVAETTAQIPNDATLTNISSPPVSSNGTIAGSAGVSGGAATYSIPIQLPPGRAGMQPEVSLNYSSRNGNSIAGMGWSLAASSSISRCAATYAQDGFSQNPQYNTHDRLCLDGQRLIATSGIYGNSGTQYRTEIDSFTRVTQNGSLNGTSTWFKVEYKNGRVGYFGKSADSRLVHDGKTQAYSWLIDYERDATAKNFMQFHYGEFGKGEKLLTFIYYTGNSVYDQGNRYIHFHYEDRIDRRTNYLAGGAYSSTKLLTEISTFVGEELVWNYRLNYATSLSSQRSLLRDIKQCNSEVCLPQTAFSWLEAAPSYSFEPLELKNGNSTVEVLTQPFINKVIPRGDANGDGVRDWPAVDLNNDGVPEQTGLSANAEGEVTSRHSDPLGYCFRPYASTSVRCLEGDFNLDGRTDAFTLSGGWGSNGLFKIKYAGSSSWINTEISKTHYSDEPLAIDDFNGDGWPDIVFRQVDDGVNWKASITIFFNTKNSNRPFTVNSSQVLVANAVTRSHRGTVNYVDLQSLGDLDGNGTSDFILYQGSGLVPAIAIPDKIFFVTPSQSGSATISEYEFSGHLDVTQGQNIGEANLFHDVNGDGLLDWLAVDVDSNLAVRINRGGDFDTTWQNLNVQIPMYEVGYMASISEAETLILPNLNLTFAMDYNGDGKQELLFANAVAASACSEIENWRYVNGREVLSTDWFCDNQLWSLIKGRHDAFNIRSVNGAELDVSARHYKAIYFDEANTGELNTSTKATDIIASADQKAAIDATGNGLVDVVTTFDCQRPGCKWNLDTASLSNNVKTDPSIENRLYINRNLGSHQGRAKSAQGLSNYNAVDVMSRVTNGVGHSSDWQYKPLASDLFNDQSGEFYSVTNHFSTSPYFYFTSSMLTVAQFGQSDGIGGKVEKRFKYRDAMFNPQGRGFMGFKSIAEENITTELVTQFDFKQVFPYQGKLLRQATFELNDFRSRGMVYLTDNEPNALNLKLTSWQENTNHSIDNVYSNYAKTVKNITRLPSTSTGIESSTEKSQVSTEIKEVLGIDKYGNTTSVSNSKEDSWGLYKTTELNTFESNETDWWLNKLTNQVVTKHPITGRNSSDAVTLVDDPKTTITYEFSEFHSNRKAKKTVVLGHKSGQVSGRGNTTSIIFNNYGLPTQVTQTAETYKASNSWSDQIRTSKITYSKNGTTEASDGYFPYKQTNAKGHISYTEVKAATGQITETRQQLSGNSYLTTRYTFDDYNRPYSSKTDGQPIVYTAVQSPDVQAPENAVIQIVKVSAGQPAQKVYQDKLGRVLRTAVEDFNGDWVFTDINYDAKGYKAFESVPYKEGSRSYGVTYTNYDILGRLTEKVTNQACGDMTTTYAYSGLKTDITATEDCNNKALDMSRTYNSLKQLMETVDAAGGITRYSYNAQGLPIVIQDANGNKILAKYNALGHKTQVDDPNQGVTNFEYNGFGELQREIRVGSKTLSYVTDVLGRVTRRTGTRENTLSYTYDGATYGLGQLSQATGNGVTKTFSFDSHGRPATQTITGSGKSYKTTTFYDANYGRVKGLRYPNDLTISYDYTNSGYLQHVKNTANDYIYKTVTDQDVFGNITAAKLGNGTSETATYSEQNGQMLLKSVAKGTRNLMNINYQSYDGFGNLKQVDVTTGNLGIDQHQFSESYVYDDLHRLKSNAVNGHEITHYSYDSVGNLLSKSDYATEYDYTTGTTGGPNAVKRVYRSGSWKTFSYDARGNMTKGDGLSHAIYNAMDKPIQLIKEGKTLNFTYGPQHMRFKQVNGSVTTFYSDKLYEEDIDGTKTTWRAYIDDIAVISQTTDETASIRYTHRDRLQSARIITDYNGYVSTQRNYDPFGKPRLASGGLMPIGNAKLNDLADAKTRRGFTDHEHLDDIELIHMNGRVYDYNLGRFMSVDPIIQSPTNSQSINPYSYIMNNPLAGIDPTGYCSTDDTLKDCARGLEERKVQAITDSNGRTVGQIGKDSFNKYNIVDNGNEREHSSLSSSLNKYGGKNSDIGSQSSIANQVISTGIEQGQRLERQSLIYEDLLYNPLSEARNWVFDNLINPIPDIEASINAVVSGDYSVALESITGIVGKKVKAVGTIGEGVADGVNKLTERVRHFTNNKGLEGIRESSVIKASDQNSVFTVKARGKVGSSRDIEKQLGINRGKAGNYVEFNAHPSEFKVIKNSVTGATERVFKGNVDLTGRDASFHKNR